MSGSKSLLKRVVLIYGGCISTQMLYLSELVFHKGLFSGLFYSIYTLTIYSLPFQIVMFFFMLILTMLIRVRNWTNVDYSAMYTLEN